MNKRQRKLLDKLIEEYAEAKAHSYYMDDQGRGGEVKAAQVALQEAKLELMIALDNLEDE